MSDAQWPAEWMRGVLEVCVLRVVGRGPTYGYAIAQALEESGLGTIKGGTLYPLLARFESAGLVAVEWRPGTSGPGRKYYTLTATGRDEAARRSADWLAFSEVARALLTDRATSTDRARPSDRTTPTGGARPTSTDEAGGDE